MQRESLKRDIAIIGASCMFSGCDNPHTFWEKLAGGNELIEFYTDQELLENGVENRTIQDPNYVKVKTFIEYSDAFDYSFFGYTKDEANSMDPQTRILHQLVWEAFEDSCYDPSRIQDKVGLYLTAPDNFNWIAHTTINKKDTVDPFYLSQINNKNFCSSLISYNLNLKGPSIFMDTACSSSLVAMHTACRALLLRECSMAVAGGIALNTKDEKGYMYEEGMISSKDGHCRAFDEHSSGTVGTEGGGVVVLKRLEDALKDNDHIYAIVRATAVNNDGKRKVGYTAPSISGQSDCIKQAHNFAKVSPDEISYIETHGTGTKLGDPIEIEALNKSFNYDQTLRCAIGAVKSNLGHTGNAAGIAGIIKTALSLKNKIIPPSLHYVKANSEISFNKGPFYVNTQMKPWEVKDGRPLIAGVSSFGIGGTNAHVILENFVADYINDHNDKKISNVITYSAKRPEAVRQYFTKLKKFITENQEINLSDLSYSLNTGRSQFDYRNTITFKDREDLLNELEAKKDLYQKAKSSQHIVFVFPGQGAQYFKMGEQLYHQEESFKHYIDQGLSILKNKFQTDYSQILGYGGNQTSDALKINETQYTQPLLFLIEYALAKFLIELGIKPSLMIGHSLGEYVAACISGVLSFEDGLLLVAKRALLMSEMPTGKMVAVNASFEQIKNEITDRVSIAAINSDNTTVLSGREEDIKECINVLNDKNITTTFLKTSHAFHSHMMDDISTDFGNIFYDITLSTPEIPYISNLTASLISEDQVKSPQYWKEQMLNTVLFEKGIKNILKDPKEYIFIELGPSTLANAIMQNQSYKDSAIIQLLRKSGENEEQQFLNRALGKLWQSGVEIDWTKYYHSKKRRKVSLPTYAFEKNKLDFHVNPFKRFTIDNSGSPLDLFYQKKWKKIELHKGEKEQKATYIIFSEDHALSQNIIQELDCRGISFLEVRKNEFLKENQEIDLDGVEDYLNKIKEASITNYQIVFNWNIQDNQLSSMVSIFRLFNIIGKFLISNDLTSRSKVTLLGDLNNMELNENSNTALLSSFNQLYVCAQENKNIFSFLLDIPSGNNIAGDKIIDEIEYNFSEPVVTYKEDQRYSPFYERCSVGKVENTLLDSKVIVVIGGSGKMGRVLINYLLKSNAKIAVIGRKSIDRLDEEFRREIGNEVSYHNADISNFQSLESTIALIEQKYTKIDGILNLAGNPSADSLKLVEHIAIKDINDQFSSKVQGIINLYKVFSARTPDFIWISSSLSAILGGQTFGAYSVANSYMDYFIGKSKPDNWICVNLDGFSESTINEAKLVEIFKATVFSKLQNHQIITSVKNPNQYLTYAYKMSNKPVDTISSINLYSTEYVEPVSTTEIKLCDVFNNFFEPKKVGITDNFFELGGDSLKAMTILKSINKEFNLELTPQDLYKTPTIKGLALHIEMILYVSNAKADNESNRKTIII